MTSTQQMAELINGVAAVLAAYVKYAETNGGPPAEGFAQFLKSEADQIPATPDNVPGHLRIEAAIFDAVAEWLRTDSRRKGHHLRIVPGGKDDDE